MNELIDKLQATLIRQNRALGNIISLLNAYDYNCNKCGGTGTYFVQNGPDDVDPVECPHVVEDEETERQIELIRLER